MGSGRSLGHTGQVVPLLGGHLAETVAAPSQQTPENSHIRWCWNRVVVGEAWCQTCVVIFRNPRNAAATLSRELFLGRAGTRPQSRDISSSTDRKRSWVQPAHGHCLVRPSAEGQNGSKPQSLGSEGSGNSRI